MPVAATTTYCGRNMIAATLEYIERNYDGVSVIYGDTDSVMIQFPYACPLLRGVPQERVMPMVFESARAMARAATAALFTAPISLEFEKVYWPYLLFKKKKYCGMKYMTAAGPPDMDAKGIEIVRRDFIALLRTSLPGILSAVLVEKSLPAAYQRICHVVTRLVENEVNIEEMTTTKSRKANYANPDAQPHIVVVRKMEARRAFGIPRVGDRVPYVILEGAAKNVSARAEHPEYAVRHGCKLDRIYYLGQMRAAVFRLLEHVAIPHVEKLFQDALGNLQRQRQGMRRITDFGWSVTSSVSTARPEQRQPQRPLQRMEQMSLASFLSPALAFAARASADAVAKRQKKRR